MLTTTRSTRVRLAEWSETNLESSIWTIPAARENAVCSVRLRRGAPVRVAGP